MSISKLLLGVGALALFAAPAFAEDYVVVAVKTMTIDGKNVLTDAKGMTLYTFDQDKAGVYELAGGQVRAVAWPPASGERRRCQGIRAISRWGEADRRQGMMWAYYGLPLYGWIKDKKPGDTTGDMVGNVWHNGRQGLTARTDAEH